MNIRQAYVCTKEQPWKPEYGKPALHPDSKYQCDIDHDDGTCEVYTCPNCGISFHVELPD